VYVARENNRIIASAACALRDAVVNGKVVKVGHEFQAFVDPEYRGRRIAGQLHQVRENYLQQHGAVLAYALIMEGNTPSMRYIGRQGFQRHCTLVMPSIMVYQKLDTGSRLNIRPIAQEDLAVVANLVNETWQNYELYEPMTADSFARLIARTPAYSYDNILVLEESNQIMACLGFWDWNRVMQITVKALSLKMRAMGILLDMVRLFRPIPRGPQIGDTLKQMALTPIGFRDREYLTALLRHMNNQALSRGIEQMFCLCPRDHPLLTSLKGFLHIDTDMHLYVKPLRDDVSLSDQPVFINGLDL